MYSRFVMDSMVPVLFPCLAFLIWYVSNLVKFGETTIDEPGPPNDEPDPDPLLIIPPDGETIANRDFYADYARMLDAFDVADLEAEIAEFQKENPLTPVS